MGRAIAAGSGSTFDARRNSSRTLAPLPDALPNALRALRALRRAQPALVAWIEEGAPRLTEADHFARFGEVHPGRAARGRGRG